jgi:hypothetical protein
VPPILQHVEEFCDGCAVRIGEVASLAVPARRPTSYRASRALELMDGDLCARADHAADNRVFPSDR